MWRGIRRRYQRAIEIDPNFATGYEKIGEDYFNLGELGRAREYFHKAFELQEHVSEREKLVITSAYYSNVTGELGKAARTYQEWIENYPRDSGPRHNLGNMYAMQGQWEKASEAYGECVQLARDAAI
jgi:tetratricopeptide (TPR) repeat protein